MSTVKDLVIRAVSLAGQPLTHTMTARFDQSGGTLGRSDSNTLALPDPRRHISRLQAEVVLQGGRYALRNAGNANPIVVNQTSVPPGASVALAHGDELQIGAYVLRATLEDPQPRSGVPATGASVIPAHTVIMASAGEPKTHPRRKPATEAPDMRARGPRPAASDPQTMGLGGIDIGPGASSPSSNPFADLLGPSGASAPCVSQGRAAPSPAAANPWAVDPGRGAPAPVPARAPLPDDFDPFAAVTTIRGGAQAPADVPARADDPFGGLLQRTPAPSGVARQGAARIDTVDPIAAMLPPAASSIDELFDLAPVGSGPRRDILGDFLSEALPASDGRDGRGEIESKLDPMAMFTPAGAAPTPRSPGTVLPDHTPELHAAYRPPEVLAPTPRRAEPSYKAADHIADHATPAPRREPVDDAHALWRAFEQGAGIDALPAHARTPELMGIIGRMLRASIDGTLRLMAARAATKQELRAQVTVIQTRDNNPLKFTLDGQAAVDQLLRPPMRGFMPGTDAMQDAMDDLLGHAAGTMAGMRAALDGVLARFTPAQLEAALSEPSMLDKLLPMNRHAKLWELYLAHHARVKAEAEDRFQSLFGAAFVTAYEEQLEALGKARRTVSKAAAGGGGAEPAPPDATLPAA